MASWSRTVGRILRLVAESAGIAPARAAWVEPLAFMFLNVVVHADGGVPRLKDSLRSLILRSGYMTRGSVFFKALSVRDGCDPLSGIGCGFCGLHVLAR